MVHAEASSNKCALRNVDAASKHVCFENLNDWQSEARHQLGRNDKDMWLGSKSAFSFEKTYAGTLENSFTLQQSTEVGMRKC